MRPGALTGTLRSSLRTGLAVGPLLPTAPEVLPAVHVVEEVRFGELVPGVSPREAPVADGQRQRRQQVPDDVMLVGHLTLAHHTQPRRLLGEGSGRAAYHHAATVLAVLEVPFKRCKTSAF